MDLSEILEVPLETDFNQVMMEAASTAAIAPAMPVPSKPQQPSVLRPAGV